MLVKINQFPNFSLIFNHSIHAVGEQDKLIIKIAIMAFACLSVLGLLWVYCFSNNTKKSKLPIQPVIVNIPPIGQIKVAPEPVKLANQLPKDPKSDLPIVDEATDPKSDLPIVDEATDPKSDLPIVDEATELQPNSPKAYAKKEPLKIPESQRQLTIESALDQLDESKPQTFYQLAMLLKSGEKIDKGKYYGMDRRSLLIKVIFEMKYEDADAYYHLGRLLDEVKKEEAFDEIGFSKRDLFKKSIVLKPDFPKAYYELGILLGKDETIDLLSKKWNKKDLLSEAIKRRQNLPKAFCALGMALNPGEKHHLPNLPDMDQEKLYLKAIEINHDAGEAYYLLACLLEKDKTILINGQDFSRAELLEKASTSKPPVAKAHYELGKMEMENAKRQYHFLQAIQLDPNLAEAYCALGATLKENECILINKSEMIQKDLFKKAIDVNPAYGEACYRLAMLIGKNGQDKLINGAIKTQKDLFLLASQATPPYAQAFYELGRLEEDSAKKQENYLDAIKWDSTLAEAYCALGSTLEGQEKIYVNNSENSQLDLFLAAIRLNDKYGEAYYRLGAILGSHDTVDLPNGTKKSKKDLYIISIELEPSFAPAYAGLATLLGEEESIDINSKAMNRQDLYVAAIEKDLFFIDAYYELGLLINQDTELTLGKDIRLPLSEEKQLTQETISLEIIGMYDLKIRKPAENVLGWAYYILYESLVLTDSNGPIMLLNDVPMTRRNLYDKAKELKYQVEDFIEYREKTSKSTSWFPWSRK